MDNIERMDYVVRTAAKLTPEDRMKVAERILEVGETPDRKATSRWLALCPLAEAACGCRVDGTRRASSVMIRKFVAWRMKEEGYIHMDIARALGVNHATVYNYIRQMKICFELPVYYHRDIEMYTRFIEEIQEHEQVREQEDRDD